MHHASVGGQRRRPPRTGELPDTLRRDAKLGADVSKRAARANGGHDFADLGGGELARPRFRVASARGGKRSEDDGVVGKLSERRERPPSLPPARVEP